MLAATADVNNKVRATRAYLAGFGTSGSLLAGAALMFVLASAIVAFRGWPQVTAQNPVVNVAAPRLAVTASSRAGRILQADLRAPGRTAPSGGAGLSVTHSRAPGGGSSAGGGAPRGSGGSSAGSGGHTTLVASSSSSCTLPTCTSTPTVPSGVGSVTGPVSQAVSQVGSAVSGATSTVTTQVSNVTTTASGVVKKLGATSSQTVTTTASQLTGTVTTPGLTAP